jgi:hypothetical protein
MTFDGYLRKLAVALPAAITALALAAPLASAVTAEQFLRVHSPADAAPAPEHAVDHGFSWAAAGVGAGTVALLILASVALLTVTGRVHLRTAAH